VLPSHLHQLISQTTNVVPQISKKLASQNKKLLALQKYGSHHKTGPSTSSHHKQECLTEGLAITFTEPHFFS
jgi:hypothetical protein